MATTYPHPVLIAHRGMTSAGYENTMAAFRAAVENQSPRFTGIELDIHTTTDGDIVVHHDSVLASGEPIAALSLDRIRAARLPDGSEIPTLEQVMALTGTTRLYIEVKGLDPRWDAELIGLIRGDGDPNRCQVHSFDHRVVSRLGRAAPELVTGVLSSSYPIDPVGPVKAAGAWVLWQQWELIDADLVAACRADGIEVVAWTVPDGPTAQRLTALGVVASCIDA
jgi:glycerophosphoryl diester phosphodiesterase